MLSELAFSFYPSQEQATSARLVSAKRDARFEAMDRELGEVGSSGRSESLQMGTWDLGIYIV